MLCAQGCPQAQRQSQECPWGTRAACREELPSASGSAPAAPATLGRAAPESSAATRGTSPPTALIRSLWPPSRPSAHLFVLVNTATPRCFKLPGLCFHYFSPCIVSSTSLSPPSALRPAASPTGSPKSWKHFCTVSQSVTSSDSSQQTARGYPAGHCRSDRHRGCPEQQHVAEGSAASSGCAATSSGCAATSSGCAATSSGCATSPQQQLGHGLSKGAA